LETERFSKDAICSSLFRCSSRTVRLIYGLFLFFLDFAIRSFLNLVLPTEWQRVGNQINPTMIFARADFVNVHREP